MASMRSLTLSSARQRLTVMLIVLAALLTFAVVPHETTTDRAAAVPPTAPNATRVRLPKPNADLAVPAELTDPALDMRAGPVAVPLELKMPSLGVDAPVVGVGITPKNVMAAPMGKANDPVWQQAFWYRGSAIPGDLSTALIAGHIDGHGRPAVFAELGKLRPGDPIVVHDTRSGLDVRFSVTESKSYSLSETTEPAVLTKMYGSGPVAGNWSEPSTDGLAHLTLVTCTGTFRNGTHDHRLAVYATRVA